MRKFRSYYRSGLEDKVADLFKKKEISYEYETLKIPYTITHSYKPDFILKNGVILEVKGYFEAVDRTKMKQIKKENPDLDIRLVFQDPSKPLRKGAKSCYWEWAEKNGFPWCQYPYIPEDWLT